MCLGLGQFTPNPSCPNPKRKKLILRIDKKEKSRLRK